MWTNTNAFNLGFKAILHSYCSGKNNWVHIMIQDLKKMLFSLLKSSNRHKNDGYMIEAARTDLCLTLLNKTYYNIITFWECIILKKTEIGLIISRILSGKTIKVKTHASFFRINRAFIRHLFSPLENINHINLTLHST